MSKAPLLIALATAAAALCALSVPALAQGPDAGQAPPTAPASPAPAPAPAPSQPVTTVSVAVAFANAVANICPAAIEAGGVEALPEALRAKLQPAPDDTRWLSGRAAKGPTFMVDDVRLVQISEPEPGLCRVVATGPGLTPTFDFTEKALLAPERGFRKTEDKDRGASRRYLRGEGPEAIRVILGGSEPGRFGHASRFSVLIGSAQREGRSPPGRAR